MRPEERAAARLVERHGLTPPVDIEALVSRYADLELVDVIPCGVDGLYVPRLHRRDLIVVATQKSAPQRIRFSLAHELGHKMLPWHVGLVSCHSDPSSYDPFPRYQTLESEANRFASGVLAPRRWLETLVARHRTDPTSLYHAALATNLSDQATCLALTNVLPVGHALVIVDADHNVLLATQSQHTQLGLPAKGTKLDEVVPRLAGTRPVSVARPNGRVILWWVHVPDVSLVLGETRTSKVILKKIMTDLQLDPVHGDYRSIQGSTAGFRRRNCVSAEELMRTFLHAYAAWEKGWDARIRAHPDWRRYLSQRAVELVSKWTNSRSTPR